jgi:hydroxymethylbilane synthase
VATELRKLGVEVVMVPIITAGDVSTTPLGQSGGVGLFTKEIQRALLDGRCDLAVHSLKDLPTDPVEGLLLAAVPEREDVGDCLIGRTGKSLAELPTGAKIGTGSQRRAAQIRAMRPDVEILDIRGNLDTRLKKLDDGHYDAILLAAAGLKRLELDHRVTQRFSSDEMLPAVGQAALGLETRFDDCATIDAIERLSHLPTHQAVVAERAMLRALRGGCLAPVAALATPRLARPSGSGDFAQNRLTIRARVLAVDGTSRVETEVTGRMDLAVDIGLQAAKLLEIGGANRWIEAARSK